MKFFALTLFPLALILTGCLSPGTSPSVRYFRLSEQTPAPEAIGSLDIPTQVGPIELAPYLRRPQRATREGEQEITYHEFERWAEPLEINLADTLTRDLTALLNSEQIIAYSPRTAINSIPQQLRIHIHRFDVNDKGQAGLLATYALVTDPSQVYTILRFQASLPVTDPSPAGHISALNTLIHQFAEVLAIALTNDTP